MFRRPSLPQSSSSAVENGHPLTSTSANRRDHMTKRSVSNTSTTTVIKEGQDFNTDELFTKHTIAEIRVIQNRLGTDANVKKEELRQMVGERYRDLLQASSSIISIARSSKRVVEALEESKTAIQTQADPPLPKSSSSTSIQDKHLRSLQILAAHIKLLLDAPEHLWRLIERKKFFPAAWLFLLARVIHRALVRNDEQDEETWKSQDVDVLAEFPLIQRQWEAISQFRSQIIHKATLSLRDASSSVEDTCATLVTLHLLDSRPLHDTLTAMFLQRAKTLKTTLGTKSRVGSSLLSPHNPSGSANGITYSFSQESSISTLIKSRIREVKESLHNALAIISQTIHVARGIFDKKSEPSLIERVLGFIQSDGDKNKNVPTELHLTTQDLLTNVTSTAHFQLLPQNLQSYKPYVDLTSSSASLRQEQFLNQMNEFFNESTRLFQGAVEGWLGELETVKEVWNVRTASWKWIYASTLEKEEKARVMGIVDRICRQRVVEIWKSMLKAAAGTFETTLDVALRSFDSGQVGVAGSLVDFLFNPVSLPVLSQPSSNHDIPLQKYQNSLKQQSLGRTVLLDSVLDTLEKCASSIHEEFSFIQSRSPTEVESIVHLLSQLYEPAAQDLTKSILHTLEKVVNQVQGDDDASSRKLVFLGQITEDLALRSLFINQIRCGEIAHGLFAEQLSTLNSSILDTWKRKTVSRMIRRASSSLRLIPTPATGPSQELVQALISLYEILQEVTFRWDTRKQAAILQGTLALFVDKWLDEGPGRINATEYDIAFLLELVKLASVPKASGTTQELEHRLKDRAGSPKPEISREASEHIKRLQTFFPVTLQGRSSHESADSSTNVDKFPNLLRYGLPSTEHQTSSDFAKPGPRFGLLLVGGDSR